MSRGQESAPALSHPPSTPPPQLLENFEYFLDPASRHHLEGITHWLRAIPIRVVVGPESESNRDLNYLIEALVRVRISRTGEEIFQHLEAVCQGRRQQIESASQALREAESQRPSCACFLRIKITG